MRLVSYHKVITIAALASTLSCESSRRSTEPTLTYAEGIGALLTRRCGECHRAEFARGAWIATSFAGAVGCVASGRSAVGDGERAPILTVLDRPDHASLLDADERERLARWVESGAPSMIGGAHPQAFFDPRSPASHGNFLRERRYAPMLDGRDDDACGRCHEGAPSKSETTSLPAPNATPCTTCHDDPGGVVACTTCHGAPGKLYPPRDPCFHPDAASDRGHPAHAGPSASRAEGYACATCHPVPDVGDFSGAHTDGHAEVWFDYAVTGRDAMFDTTSRTCTGTCHARGGATPVVRWSEASTRTLGCNDCHATPPAKHYAGTCTSCHREANADGTALVAPKLHAGGRVVLGDGSGACGACHGKGGDPWPSTGAHPKHETPADAKPVACATCHDVPLAGDRHPVGGGAKVRLLGLAAAGGRRPTFDATTKSCASTYCHEGPGATRPTPRWTDGSGASTCGACHATPPPPPHSSSNACETCHGPRNASTHVDGFVSP